MKIRPIRPLLLLALFLPAVPCAAQESLPRRETSAPGASTTPTPIPQSALGLIPPPAGQPAAAPPNMPDLSQLDQIFKQTVPGKEVVEYRHHVEWRELKNRTVNDPAVVSAKEAAATAITDLEKRNRLRNYYEVFYARMRAHASTPEMVAYLDSMKKAHTDQLTQPRVRPTVGSEEKAKPANLQPATEQPASPTPEQPVLPTPEPVLPNE
jgi:hypothetical protein